VATLTRVGEWLSISSQSDVEQVRRVARETALAAGLNAEIAAEWTLVASELATNLLRHTPLGGSMKCLIADEPRSALIIYCQDAGPGIASVSAAMVEGFTTASGLGGGLATVQRFSDDLQIDTSPEGTLITVKRWLP